MKFRGCKHLDFKDNYSECNKVIIGDHVCWERVFATGDMPRLVQFCKRRGRLNNPSDCIGECRKRCSDYEEVKHTVED